jgi:hypothetical protein
VAGRPGTKRVEFLALSGIPSIGSSRKAFGKT